ncbi:MAG: hypothetical protein ACPLPW_00430 [bacterium]
MGQRCKYITIIKKPLIKGSPEEIYQFICRAGEEKVIGTPANLNLPCSECAIGKIFSERHCQFLEAEKRWGEKPDYFFKCRLLNKKGFDPTVFCPKCNDYEIGR